MALATINTNGTTAHRRTSVWEVRQEALDSWWVADRPPNAAGDPRADERIVIEKDESRRPSAIEFSE
jgi:hypothetical protein